MAEIDFSGFYSESEESKADKWGPEEDRLSSEDEGDGSGRTSDKEIDGESAGEMHSEEDLPKSQPGGVSHDQSGGGSEHVAEGRPEEDVHQEEGPIGERGGSGGQPRDGAHGTGSRKEQAAEGEVPEARGAPEETGGGEQRTAAEPGGTHGDPNRFYKYKKRYFSLMKSGQRRFQFPVPMQQISFLMSPHGRFHVRSTQSLRENPAMQELIPEIADIMAARYELKKTEANVVKGARARRRLARQAEKSNRPAPDPQKPQSTSSLLKKRARRIAGTDAYKSHIESVMEGVDGEFCSRDSCPQSHAELGEAAPCFKIRRALQLPDNLPLLKNVGLYNTAELKVFVSTFQAFEVLNPVDQAAEDGRGEPPQPEVAADPPRRTKGGRT